MEKVIFLDRDGVINVLPYKGSYITEPKDFILLRDVPKAIKKLNDKGYKVVVVTNQRCIFLNLLTEDGLKKIHEKLSIELANHGAHIDYIFHCPHDLDSCDCRKPKIGMFNSAENEIGKIDKKNSFMVGDNPNDVLAGKAFGVRTVFIENEIYNQEELTEKAEYIAKDLLDAVNIICNC